MDIIDNQPVDVTQVLIDLVDEKAREWAKVVVPEEWQDWK